MTAKPEYAPPIEDCICAQCTALRETLARGAPPPRVEPPSAVSMAEDLFRMGVAVQRLQLAQLPAVKP